MGTPLANETLEQRIERRRRERELSGAAGPDPFVELLEQRRAERRAEQGRARVRAPDFAAEAAERLKPVAADTRPDIPRPPSEPVGPPPAPEEPRRPSPDLLAATRRAVEQPMRADVLAEPPKPAPEQRPYAEQGLVGEAVAGLGRGAGQIVEATGGMGEVLSRVLGAPHEPPKQVTSALRSVAETGERIKERPELARSEAASDAFNPRSLRWWVAGISEVAPQMLAQLGAAALTGGGSAAIAAFGAPAFVLEGGLAYRQALENGASPEQATGISLLTGVGSAALETIPGSVILLNRFPGARAVFQRSLLARLGARGAAAGTAEGATEVGQEAWADAVAAASKTDPDAFEDWRKRYPAAAAIGAAVGAGATVGTRGEAPSKPAVAAPEELTPEPRAAIEAPPPGTTLPETPTPGVLPVDAPPGSVGEYPLTALSVNPQRFQYKADVDPETGAGRELESVGQFDRDLAGVVSVWRDPADGRVYVVNGHHRYELAQRAGEATMAVRFVDAADASEARQTGALINIAEGRGTAIDAAKLFREGNITPEQLAERNISLRGQVARDGLALARLHPALFDRVVRQELPVARAVVIGRGDLTPEQQLDLVRMLEQRRREPTNAELDELIRFARSAPETTSTQENLFGEEVLRQSLVVEKAALSAEVKRQIASDRRLGSAVARMGEEIASRGLGQVDIERGRQVAAEAGTLAELYNRLSVTSGRVADALNRGAQMVAEGRSTNDVANEIRPAITAALEAELAALSRAPIAPAALPRAGAARAGRGREVAGGRPRGAPGGVAPQAPRGPLAEPTPPAAGQGTLVGSTEPVPTRQGELFGAPQRLAEAEAAARETVARLGPLIERGAANPEQTTRYREALALLRRGGGLSAEEMQLRATETAPETPEQPTLLDPVMRRVVDKAGEDVAADADVIDVDPEALPDVARLDPPPDELDPDPEAALQRIGDRIAGYLVAHEGSKPGRGVSAPEVIRQVAAIARAAGKPIPIRVGRLGRYARRARGLFFPQTMVIRINQANNIATAAHELGHGLERILFGWPDGSPWRQPLVSKRVQNELAALGKSLYGDTKPTGGYRREGWAEYVRMWITRTDLNSQPGDPAAVAPELTRWFDGSFSEQFPDVRRAFDRARRQWAEQGSLERARQSMVDTASPAERVRQAAETTRGVFTVAKWIEMAQPFKRLTQAAEQERGRPLAPEQDPYKLITALRTTHAARARYMVEHGMIDLAGNVVGPSLAEIRPLVRGREQEFAYFLWAKRTLALGADRPSGLSLEDAAAIVEELETPKFETAAGKVYNWNNGVLDYAAQASPSFRRIVERVRERDPGNYVPLQRVFDELDRDYMALPAGGGATRTSPVRRLKGSGRRIKSIIPTMIANAEQTVRAAHRRAVMEATVDLADVEGMGLWINEIPPDRVPAYTASIGRMLSEIERALSAAGIHVRLEDAQGADPNALLLAELMGETVTFFTDAQRAPNGSYIYPVWSDNRVRWFEVDPELFDALATMDVYRMHWLPELFLGRPASLLRAGTTGLRASFALVWNPLRDVQAFWVNTRSGKWGGRLFGEWLRGMTEMAVAKSTGKRSALADAYMRLGLEMTQSLGQDIPQTRLAARRLFQGRVVRTVDPRNLFELYRDLVQFPEAAPRVAEMRLRAREVGWEPGQPMNLSQSLQLMIAAKQVTTDFTAAGQFARAVNRMVPFFNASIQGPRSHWRALRHHPRRFVIRGMEMTAVTLLLWWWLKDEEWYKELTAREKFLHWHIPFDNPVTGQKELIRIPRAFEVGQAFAALPEALVDAWYRENPQEVVEWFKTAFETTRPPFLTTTLAVPAEQLANKSFYFDRPIETQSEQKRAPEERFNEYTTRAAIELGRLFGMSPKRIDHAIRGLFGPVGSDLLGLLGLGAPDTERERELADAPLVGRLFVRGGQAPSRPRSVDRMYSMLEEAQQRQYSRRNPETELQRQRRLQLQDAANATSALYYVRQNVPSREKREQIMRAIAKIAADAVRLHEAEPREGYQRERFRTLRREAERLEKQVEEAQERKAATH